MSISTLKWASYSDEKSTKSQKFCNLSKYCCFGVSITVSEDIRNKIEMNEITKNKYRVSHCDMVRNTIQSKFHNFRDSGATVCQMCNELISPIEACCSRGHNEFSKIGPEVNAFHYWDPNLKRN